MRSTVAFADVAAVLNAAVLAGKTCKYHLATKNQAIKWRQRAYVLRKLLLEEDSQKKGGAPGSTPYDALVLRIEGTTVVIGMEDPKGILTDESGNILTPVLGTEAQPTGDHYLDAASELVRELEKRG